MADTHAADALARLNAAGTMAGNAARIVQESVNAYLDADNDVNTDQQVEP